MLIIIIFVAIFTTCIVIQVLFNRNLIEFFEENSIQKIISNNYELLEIKRKRKPASIAGGFGFLRGVCSVNSSYTEYPLNLEVPIMSSSILHTEYKDIIEIYGIKNNKKHLIFTINWSKENVQKIVSILEENSGKIKSKILK